MKIQFTPQFTLSNKFLKTENNNKKVNTVENRMYNPIAYRDYDITFGARLFRTPENFYEQDFNEKGMPKSLHRYIYEGFDTDFRRTIPPSQAMKEVYGSLKFAQNLDMVKQIYPDEPLFADLHSTPSKKAREGVLGELALMRSDAEYQEKSLFKNGKDDLGLYILNKIYIEGKTLKEINKDFHRDTSVVYAGLGDIKYSDLKAFGIHFPDRSFWKSFIATREDFPYVYIPRKVEDVQREIKEIERKTRTKISSPKPNRKKFDEVKDWELDKITKTIEDTNGGLEDIKRKIRKSGNSESNNFVSQYMGEIMSVTLERLHASPEMKSFFEDYENLSVSQRAILKKFWTTPNARQNMSLVMKSTIKMFMEAYDEDGQNEEFQELLDYAHKIKPERLLQEEIHNTRQLEYELMFKELQAQEEQKVEEKPLSEEELHKIEFLDKLHKNARENNAQIYPFKLSNGSTIYIVSNLREMLAERIDKELEFYPRSYRKSYLDYIMNNYGKDPKYLLSLFYNSGSLQETYDIQFEDKDRQALLDSEQEMLVNEHLMSVKEVNKQTAVISDEFRDKFSLQYRALHEALFELLMQNPIPQAEIDKLISFQFNKLNKSGEYNNSPFEEIYEKSEAYVKSVLEKYEGPKAVISKLGDLNDGLHLAGLKFEDVEDVINQKYNFYNSKLSDTERRKIAHQVVTTFLNYDEKSSIMSNERSRRIFTAIKLNLGDQRVRNALIETLIKMGAIASDRGDMRVFLQKDADKRVLMAKSELFMMEFINENMSDMAPLLAMRRDILENVIRPVDEDLYTNLMLFRIKNGVLYR